MGLDDYIFMVLTVIGGAFLTYINWAIYKISKDIYRVSEALLEVNVELYKVSLELCKHTKTLQEKI